MYVYIYIYSYIYIYIYIFVFFIYINMDALELHLQVTCIFVQFSRSLKGTHHSPYNTDDMLCRSNDSWIEQVM